MYEISKSKFCSAMLNSGFKSFKQLANASGVSAQTISRLNRGFPAQLSTVGALASALNVSPEAIIVPEKERE